MRRNYSGYKTGDNWFGAGRNINLQQSFVGGDIGEELERSMSLPQMQEIIKKQEAMLI